MTCTRGLRNQATGECASWRRRCSWASERPSRYLQQPRQAGEGGRVTSSQKGRRAAHTVGRCAGGGGRWRRRQWRRQRNTRAGCSAAQQVADPPHWQLLHRHHGTAKAEGHVAQWHPCLQFLRQQGSRGWGWLLPLPAPIGG